MIRMIGHGFTGGAATASHTFVGRAGTDNNINGIDVSKTVTLSAAPASGDISVLYLLRASGSLTAPTGYTQIGSTYTDTTNSYNHGIFYRICNGTEGTTINFSGTTLIAAVFRGATSLIGAGSFVTGVNGTTTTSLHASTAVGDAVVHMVVDRNVGTIPAPSGFTTQSYTANTYFSANCAYHLSLPSLGSLSITTTTAYVLVSVSLR